MAIDPSNPAVDWDEQVDGCSGAINITLYAAMHIVNVGDAGAGAGHSGDAAERPGLKHTLIVGRLADGMACAPWRTSAPSPSLALLHPAGSVTPRTPARTPAGRGGGSPLHIRVRALPHADWLQGGPPSAAGLTDWASSPCNTCQVPPPAPPTPLGDTRAAGMPALARLFPSALRRHPTACANVCRACAVLVRFFLSHLLPDHELASWCRASGSFASSCPACASPQPAAPEPQPLRKPRRRLLPEQVHPCGHPMGGKVGAGQLQHRPRLHQRLQQGL